MTEIPPRTWSDEQWERVKLGCDARGMDEKWNVFVPELGREPDVGQVCFWPVGRYLWNRLASERDVVMRYRSDVGEGPSAE